VHQTFALVFNLIDESFSADPTGSDRLWILTHSVDLFVDLMGKADISQALLEYKGLGASVASILGFLGGGCEPEPAAKLLEMLVALCRAQGSGSGRGQHPAGGLLLATALADARQLPALLRWCHHSEGTNMPALRALEVLHLLVQAPQGGGRHTNGGEGDAVQTYFLGAATELCGRIQAAR